MDSNTVPMITDLELPRTSTESQEIYSSTKELHSLEFMQCPQYFLDFRYNNEREADLEYITAYLLVDSEGFYAKLPECALQERFHLSQKYRTHLFGIYSVLRKKESQNIEFVLFDKRIFDYFDKDLPNMAKTGRLSPNAFETKKNVLSNADILLPLLRFFEGRSVIFSHSTNPESEYLKLLKINQFGEQRLHDLVEEMYVRTERRNSNSNLHDNVLYPEIAEPVQKSQITPVQQSEAPSRQMQVISDAQIFNDRSDAIKLSETPNEVAIVEESAHDLQRAKVTDSACQTHTETSEKEVKRIDDLAEDSDKELPGDKENAQPKAPVQDQEAETAAPPELFENQTQTATFKVIPPAHGIEVECTADDMVSILSVLHQEIQQKTVRISSIAPEQ